MATNEAGREMSRRPGVRMAAALASVLLAFGLAMASPAQALITPVSPFTGTLSETWESFPNYNDDPNTFLDGPATIMSGGASITTDNSLIQMLVYEPAAGATFSLGSSGLAQVSDGSKGLGLVSPPELGFTTATITFTSSVPNFGGYWGAATGVTDPAIVTVSFFDDSTVPVLIGTETFTYSRSSFGDGLLEWHGWNSTIAIKSLTYTGVRVVNDGLQAAGVINGVPEPTTLVLLGSGLAGLAGWRRWHS